MGNQQSRSRVGGGRNDFRASQPSKFGVMFGSKVLLGLLLALSLCSAQSVRQTRTNSLPEPSGPFPVGTRIYHWVDRSRREKASRNPADFRQLVVQAWYPAKINQEPVGPYVPELNSYRRVWTRSQIALARLAQTHSHVEARPLAEQKLPVVLLSHGWQGTRSEYTILAEDLASEGYAVFGIDHPYMGWTALGNGKVTPATEDQFRSPAEIMDYYGSDVRFVVEQLQSLNNDGADPFFAGKLDLSRIAAIGHSSGFSAVSSACRREPRIKACINIDAPRFTADLLTGLDQPLLWIRLEKAGPVPEGFVKTAKGPIYELQIKNANHGSVEDWDCLQATTPKARLAALRRVTLIRTYLQAFLSKTLQGQSSDLLNSSVTNEVQVKDY